MHYGMERQCRDHTCGSNGAQGSIWVYDVRRQGRPRGADFTCHPSIGIDISRQTQHHNWSLLRKWRWVPASSIGWQIKWWAEQCLEELYLNLSPAKDPQTMASRDGGECQRHLASKRSAKSTALADPIRGKHWTAAGGVPRGKLSAIRGSCSWVINRCPFAMPSSLWEADGRAGQFSPSAVAASGGDRPTLSLCHPTNAVCIRSAAATSSFCWPLLIHSPPSHSWVFSDPCLLSRPLQPAND